MEKKEQKEVTFETLVKSSVPPAPQDPTTNALVQNPFAWDDEQ